MRDQRQWPWDLWLRWVGVCTLGVILGVHCIFLAGALEDVTFRMSVLAIGAFVGTPLSTIQWLVIRRFSYSPGWSGWCRWTVANAIGWGAGFPLMALCADALNPLFGLLDGPAAGSYLVAAGWLLAGLVFGTPIGVAQWRILRAEATFAYWPHAGTMWIAGAMVGWGVSIVILYWASPVAARLLEIPTLGLWTMMAAGALGGVISGAALLWILRPPASQEPPAKLD